VSADAEEHILHQTRQEHRHHQTDRCAQAGEFHPLSQDKAQHFAGLRAKRHPQPKLLRALRDRVRDHPVDPDAREHHGERRKDAEEDHGKAPLRDRWWVVLYFHPAGPTEDWLAHYGYQASSHWFNGIRVLLYATPTEAALQTMKPASVQTSLPLQIASVRVRRSMAAVW